MSVIELVTPDAPLGAAQEEWARHTRQVLTRDLLVRAGQTRFGEARSLEFRALHLNLPIVAEVSDRLGLTDEERARSEHDALDGLLQAVRLFDPYGDVEFAEFAAPYVAHRLARRRGRGT
jgi:hypothetical protein